MHNTPVFSIRQTLLILLPVVIITISSINSHVLDEVPLVDGHNDLPFNIYQLVQNNLTKFPFDKNLSTDSIWGAENCQTCHTDLPRLRAGKVGSQFWVVYVECSSQYKDAVAKSMEQIDVIKRLINKYSSDLELVVTSNGIMESFNKQKIGSLIGLEGGHSLDSRLATLRIYYDLGVRYMTLTHACNTPWADNSYVDDSSPVHNLTEFGKSVINEMNRLGMIVDLSHVSRNVMQQVLEISKAPVMFSHSSAYALCPHNRNVPDDILRLVKQNNGIVMVNFYSNFINISPQNASIHDVVAHINHIVNIAGVDHVGIGADFDGINATPRGLEDVSKFPDLFSILQSSNMELWTTENLQKLASLNIIRVFSDVEKVRDSLITEEPLQNWIPTEDLQTEGVNTWICRT